MNKLKTGILSNSYTGTGSGGGSDKHSMGYYETSAELAAAHPVGEAGDWAIVGATDTVWVWDTHTSGWGDSGSASGDFVPYAGAVSDVTLGEYRLTADGGLTVTDTTHKSYLATNCPVVYDGNDCYLPNDGEGDTGFSCLWSINDHNLFFDDGGGVDPQAILDLSGEDTPTINVTVLRADFGEPGEPFYLYITGYHDMDGDDFADLVNSLLGTGDLLENYHTEVAFTFNEVTEEYDVTMTLDVCDPSSYTTWQNPAAINALDGGFNVNPVTANITHSGNYTNLQEDAVLKTRGQLKAGNGNLIDIISCPIVSNPVMDVESSALQFAMTFVPEIAGIMGTELDPSAHSIYVAGMYGTTSVGGANAKFSGTAIGGWCAVMNSTQGNVTLSEGVAMKAGLTYAAGDSLTDLYVKNFTCFQTDFTNLNGGTSSHENVYLFAGKAIGENLTADNLYGLYLPDNSARATNAWGIYSLEENNYVKKLFVGNTAEEPNSTLQVKGSLSLPYREIDAAESVGESDYTVNCTANTFTVSLPTAAGCAGRIYVVKNSGTGTITVAADGTELIDGSASKDLAQWETLRIQSTNSGWVVI